MLIPLLLPGLGFGTWMSLNQGRAFVAFEDVDGSRSYKATAKIIDGLWFDDVFLAYHNGGSFPIDRNRYVYAQYFDLDNDNRDEIIITGSTAASVKKFILTKKNGKFEMMRNISEWGGLNEAFGGDEIYFEDIDNDGLSEIVTQYRIYYKGAPDQIWTSYYALNGNGVYQFLKVDKNNVASSSGDSAL